MSSPRPQGPGNFLESGLCIEDMLKNVLSHHEIERFDPKMFVFRDSRYRNQRLDEYFQSPAADRIGTQCRSCTPSQT